MKLNFKTINIIRPDDWHIHLREGDMLKCVINSATRIMGRCIVMPNLKIPITSSTLCKKYKQEINNLVTAKYFKPLIPCYLTDSLDLEDFDLALRENLFIGAKLYPVNSTTNSEFGITKIEKIFSAIEILLKHNKPLLIHCEKSSKDINLFDREKSFIDDELLLIINNFPTLKIVFEHVSSKYGADFIAENNNLVGTITPHHMLLTKKDVFKDEINPHLFCMPVVKDEKDLLALRNYACSGNDKFFIGTDSAPHEILQKEQNIKYKPGIFSSPCSIELYTEIFDQENSLDNLEKFASLNGPKFYNFQTNDDKIILIKKEWIVEKYTSFNGIKVKNFFGGKKIRWQIK